MRRVIYFLVVMLWSHAALAAGGHGVVLEAANVDLANKTSLQRGARLFVNYCVSCHSAAFMRYNRIAKDLDLSEEAVQTNLMFTTDKIGDPMEIAMDPADAEAWFGVAPPDLSVIARSRGADWLYNFLLGFHVDESKPTGVNNRIFKDTAMPHVLWELQGLKRLVATSEVEDSGGHGVAVPQFETVIPGSLNEREYKQAVRDIVGFLVYVGEPAKLVRYRIGFWVIMFLLVLLVPAYLMKREYWKDVH
ncbi:MAG: ubiquinol-cytochrome c reductase cytochrome c1 subunit [Gammaproteobacteria bacterium]|jgi:ubiquinol-cytochrome c reductase cytochrome c1 subunit